jgi:hypothetical protein
MRSICEQRTKDVFTKLYSHYPGRFIAPWAIVLTILLISEHIFLLENKLIHGVLSAQLIFVPKYGESSVNLIVFHQGF